MKRLTKLTAIEWNKFRKLKFSNLDCFKVKKHYGPKRYELYLETEFKGGKLVVFGTNKTVKNNGWVFEFEEYVLNEAGIGYELLAAWTDYDGSLSGLNSTINFKANELNVNQLIA
jgi:hypothetical protein